MLQYVITVLTMNVVRLRGSWWQPFFNRRLMYSIFNDNTLIHINYQHYPIILHSHHYHLYIVQTRALYNFYFYFLLSSRHKTTRVALQQAVFESMIPLTSDTWRFFFVNWACQIVNAPSDYYWTEWRTSTTMHRDIS